jgi:putative serine/threonine protein kinase
VAFKTITNSTPYFEAIKLKQPKLVQTKDLAVDPYQAIVCYPRASAAEIHNRIEELQTLGVEALEFSGKAQASNIPVLGKGYVGVVVVAYLHGEKIALKMRRIDADRESLEQEAELIKKANNVDVAPKFIAVSKNFLLMQLVDGDLLEDWLVTHKDKADVKRVLVDILEQCWRLDQAGLDHGEISKAIKHLLVGKGDKAFIVDFETASLMRKVANVNAVGQYLFVGNNTTARMLAEIFGEKSREKIIDVLKIYKKDMSRENFEKILSVFFA